MLEIEAKIKEIVPRTYNVKSLRLDVGEAAKFKAGQFMHVSLKSEMAYKRYLSISNSPTEAGYIEFTKKITQSDFSAAINNAKKGDTLLVQYPLGKFTLEDNHIEAGSKIAFLSGGIGITPIRSMCRYIADKKIDIDIALLYSNYSVKDIAFREDFEQMRERAPKLKVIHALGEAEPGFSAIIGRINAGMIKEQIPDFKERKFFLCGPPPMVEGMKKLLSDELALPQESIITENFVGY